MLELERYEASPHQSCHQSWLGRTTPFVQHQNNGFCKPIQSFLISQDLNLPAQAARTAIGPCGKAYCIQAVPIKI